MAQAQYVKCSTSSLRADLFQRCCGVVRPYSHIGPLRNKTNQTVLLNPPPQGSALGVINGTCAMLHPAGPGVAIVNVQGFGQRHTSQGGLVPGPALVCPVGCGEGWAGGLPTVNGRGVASEVSCVLGVDCGMPRTSASAQCWEPPVIWHGAQGDKAGMLWRWGADGVEMSTIHEGDPRQNASKRSAMQQRGCRLRTARTAPLKFPGFCAMLQSIAPRLQHGATW